MVIEKRTAAQALTGSWLHEGRLERLEVTGPRRPADARVLTSEALGFVAALARRFEGRRRELLALRALREEALLAGEKPDFLPETAAVRRAEWHVAPAPADLTDRRVEITGPAERKMLINALNSGAQVFMADLEDALSPTWTNVVDAQIALMEAVRRTLSFETPEGKSYRLNDRTATLVVRPRGWHLEEKHVLLDGEPISASLFDFGLYFFHNAHAALARGSGPYFYLPKLESHQEARLWNEVFLFAQEALGLPRGTIRATVLIETILAAFEMDEILYELREHAAGLNAGRWDYLFSIAKKFRHDPAFLLPDRAQLTMNVPFMRAYAELLVATCHRRNAHAIGGMAAFIPSRRDASVNEVALAKVREDKQRESRQGFDGTWVAHPDLVPVARAEFDAVLGSAPHQKAQMREDVRVSAAQLLDVTVSGGRQTEAGLRQNIDVAVRYMASWLSGVGAAAIHNLMEDAATAEIARAQIWQWIAQAVRLDSGAVMNREHYEAVRALVLTTLLAERLPRAAEAAGLLDRLVLSEEFTPFLTLPAYHILTP